MLGKLPKVNSLQNHLGRLVGALSEKTPTPNFASIAQPVEHLFCNQEARGSIPRGGTKVRQKY